jgi:3-methyladenine DNA glycosylase AlkD
MVSDDLVGPALAGHREPMTPIMRAWASDDDPTFWLRKAIGWALRDFARTDPDWVRAEVLRHGDRMSGLSRREALKHL